MKKKALNSKWTALRPKNKEKHFIVIKVYKNEIDSQKIDSIDIEAVYTKKVYNIDPQLLENEEVWSIGWVN